MIPVARPSRQRERQRMGWLVNVLPYTAGMDDDEEHEYWCRANRQGAQQPRSLPYDPDRPAWDEATYARRWG